ncbi:bifunctional lytic transglycosylase/C40 family peptidase [Streptomyces sp. NBC_00287]|uniref:C40 family peptidase n=1 Tax=Streptomyces sp. NBC_00287 TaxID=2975702 RepID=UPI002E2985A3|nr:bifunctional lytic transglycosylase/C40 family peptidase [Streptomyces sp. NBC_00287]
MGKITAIALGLVMMIAVLGGVGAGGVFSAFGSSGTQPSATALTDVPSDYLALYMDAAATCPGLTWPLLAAIGKVESDHGRSTLPGVHSGSNYAGARGPMQFLLPTFTSVVAKRPPPEGGEQPPSPYNAHDAIFTAAAYLCDSGARDGKDIPAAVRAYNPDDAYVSAVLTQAQTYAGGTKFGANASPTAALQAINYAQGQLGLPYEWGGNGPGSGDAGFDCSGLTKAAYAAAGITLPRTAQGQYDIGPRVPEGEQLKPGDLVFYGNPGGGIHHVGLYIGGEQMIDAPRPGRSIRIEPYRYRGDDFAGATRPSGN